MENPNVGGDQKRYMYYQMIANYKHMKKNYYML